MKTLLFRRIGKKEKIANPLKIIPLCPFQQATIIGKCQGVWGAREHSGRGREGKSCSKNFCGTPKSSISGKSFSGPPQRMGIQEHFQRQASRRKFFRQDFDRKPFYSILPIA